MRTVSENEKSKFLNNKIFIKFYCLSFYISRSDSNCTSKLTNIAPRSHPLGQTPVIIIKGLIVIIPYKINLYLGTCMYVVEGQSL